MALALVYSPTAIDDRSKALQHASPRYEVTPVAVKVTRHTTPRRARADIKAGVSSMAKMAHYASCLMP